MHTQVCIGLDIAHFPPLMYGFIMQQIVVKWRVQVLVLADILSRQQGCIQFLQVTNLIWLCVESDVLVCTLCPPASSSVHRVFIVCYPVGLYSEIGGQLALFSGMAGGVTQLMFSADGNYLFSGCRKVSQNWCLLCLPGKPCCTEQFVNAASHTYGACSNEQWPLLNLRMCVMYLRLFLNVCRSVWCYLLYGTVHGKGNNSVSWLTVFWKLTSLFVNFGG